MKRLFKICCVIMALISSPMLIASSQLKGSVFFRNGEMSIYTIIITPVDTIGGKGEITASSNESQFKVPVNFNGAARVSISSLACETVNRDVTFADGIDYDMGEIEIETKGVLLNDVVVKGKKAQITRNGFDYSITNLRGTHIGNAGDMFQMLRWTPGVLVNNRDKSIEVLGAGSPEIYINDRRIMDKSELTMLQSSNVSKIEIIRSPGAQYSSSTAAVIKIYTIRPLKDFVGASVYDEIMVDNCFSNRAGLNVNMKSGIVSGNFSFTYTNSRGGSKVWDNITIDRGTDNSFLSQSEKVSSYKYNPIRLFGGLNFALSKKSVLGVQYNGFYDIDGVNESSQIKSIQQAGKNYDKEIYSNGTHNPRSHTASMSYEWKRSANSSLIMLADYAYSTNNNGSVIDEYSLGSKDILHTDISNVNDYKIYTFKGDYKFSFKGADEEKVGVDFGHTDTDGGTYINEIPQLSDRKNSWVAAYYSFKRKWNKWILDAGLRYEHDYTRNRAYSENIDITQNYNNILPSVKLNYKLNSSISFSGNYKKIVSRPGFSQLNPTIYYSDSLNYYTGNPNLKPTYIDQFQIVAVYKSLSARVAYWSYKNEVVNTMQHPSENSNITIETPINLGRTNAWMASLDYNFSKDWFSMSLYAGFVVPYLEYPYLGGTKIANSFFGRTSGNFNFDLGKIFSVYLSYNCATRMEDGITRRSGYVKLNVGVQAKFFKDKLIISVDGDDLAYKNRWTQKWYADTYKWSESNYYYRTLTVNVRYTINNIKNTFKRRGAESMGFRRTY